MERDNSSVLSEPLETVAELEKSIGLKRSATYRLAKAGAIPYYAVGPKLTGIRFRRSEVLAALRRPAAGEVKR